ncbi:MAG: porin [Proteobacteria bacterium]|nr:porin [Pseudomonadota bacterium]
MRRISMKTMLLSPVFAMALSPAVYAAPSDAEALAELKRVIAQQQKMIETQSRALESLASKVEALSAKTRGNQAAASSQAASSPQAAAPAAKVVTSGEENISLAISGQVNRGALYYDDGDSSDVLHVDNDNSSTRIRLVGKGKVNDDVTIGTEIEVQMESNSTASVSQLNDNGVGGASFTERKLEVYFDSKRLGRVWIGQGDTASNGTSEMDLSGTSVVNYSSIADMAGGLFFQDNTPITAANPRIGLVFSNFDGLSRDDRIRYDTPKLAGFTLSASHISGGAWDVALRYAADYEKAGIKTAAAVAYADGAAINSFDEQLNGSLSLLHRSGINGTFAAGTRSLEAAGRSDANFIYGKIGYIANLTAIGDTAFSIDYMQADDVAATGDDATTYGVFAVQKLTKFGTELYGGIRNHELDRPGRNYDDVQAVLVGTRVKF